MVTARHEGVFGFGLLVGALLAATPVYAGSIGGQIVNVNSDLTNESNNITGTDVAISDVDPAWATAGSGASWISYADTGFNVCLPGNSNGAPCPGNTTVGTPTAVFSKDFTLPFSDNIGTITVWADDTAAVYLDGTLLIPGNSSLGGHCANGPIGCMSVFGAAFNFSDVPVANPYISGAFLPVLGSGGHVLTIDAYQLGGGPFGVLFQGSIDSQPAPAPEPASSALLGLGLAGVAFLVRRKRA